MTPHTRTADAATFWRRRARWTALRHNLGEVLGTFLPAGLGVSAVFACVLLVARQQGAVGEALWTVYGGALVACGGLAVWLAARHGFFTTTDGLVRLEAFLGLHNRISAAAAGVGTFPPPQPAPDGYSFRWRKIVPPVAAAAVLLAAALAVKIPAGATAFVPETPPVALAQTADWLDLLKKTDLVQPPALEDVRARLEQLRQQPARDWYSQSSLEAGDNLHGQTQQSLEALQRDLRTAAGSLEAMQRLAEHATPAEAKALSDRLQEAIKGLELGNLPLNRELLSQLKGLDAGSLKNLTAEQLATLKQRLQNGAKITEAMLQPGKPGDKAGADALALLAAAAADSSHGVPGGPGGGTTSSPLDFRNQPTHLDSTATERVPGSGDLDHALPGEIVGVGKGEHTVDPATYTGPTSAGPAASEGAGGEAVWRDDLTPREREVLRNFFK